MTAEQTAALILAAIPVIYVDGTPVPPVRAGVANGRFWWLDGTDKLHAPELAKAQVLYGGKALQWPGTPTIYVCPLDDADDVENAHGQAQWQSGADRFTPGSNDAAWLDQEIKFLGPQEGG